MTATRPGVEPTTLDSKSNVPTVTLPSDQIPEVEPVILDNQLVYLVECRHIMHLQHFTPALSNVHADFGFIALLMFEFMSQNGTARQDQ